MLVNKDFHQPDGKEVTLEWRSLHTNTLNCEIVVCFSVSCLLARGFLSAVRRGYGELRGRRRPDGQTFHAPEHASIYWRTL